MYLVSVGASYGIFVIGVRSKCFHLWILNEPSTLEPLRVMVYRGRMGSFYGVELFFYGLTVLLHFVLMAYTKWRQTSLSIFKLFMCSSGIYLFKRYMTVDCKNFNFIFEFKFLMGVGRDNRTKIVLKPLLHLSVVYWKLW